MLLLYFITVGAKETGPSFFTCEIIARAMMKELMLVMYNVYGDVRMFSSGDAMVLLMC